ncbi:MAG: hypothetical protein AB9903_01220 [Vulcanimicrobiota bacterium]
MDYWFNAMLLCKINIGYGFDFRLGKCRRDGRGLNCLAHRRNVQAGTITVVTIFGLHCNTHSASNIPTQVSYPVLSKCQAKETESTAVLRISTDS